MAHLLETRTRKVSPPEVSRAPAGSLAVRVRLAGVDAEMLEVPDPLITQVDALDGRCRPAARKVRL